MRCLSALEALKHNTAVWVGKAHCGEKRLEAQKYSEVSIYIEKVNSWTD